MMKPRQIKKNSKSAMEVLVKVFGFKRKDFFLEDSFSPFEWNYITSIGDSYCEDGGSWMSAMSMLEEDYVMRDCEWKEDPKTYFTYPIFKRPKLYGIPLIKECRKFAKAGVKYK